MQEKEQPFWDTQRERWTLIVRVSERVWEHREVANPQTGAFRDPPAGVTTRPKNR